MKEITVYAYQGDKGVIVTGLKMQQQPIYTRIRLIADQGKLLTNGEEKRRIIEVTSEEVKNWSEIEATEEDYAEGRIYNSNYVNYRKLLEIVAGEEEVIE